MASACHISALLLTFLGFTILLVTSVSNSWKISPVITTEQKHEGLWMYCAATSLGSVECKKFYYFLSLDTYIQACRALMITSLILGMGGTLLALLGLKCTQLGSNDEGTKARISMMSGMLFIIAGLSSMIAISWYAARITTQFFDSLYGGTKYELGPALYLGWAGSILSIFGGIILMCSSSKGRSRSHGYHYAAAERVNVPQVCVKESETITPTKDYV